VPSAQDFGDGPGLSDAAARRERAIAVKNLAEGPQTVRMELLAKGLEETQRFLAVTVHAVVGEHERAKQPAPSGAPMIGSVTVARTATITARVARFAGSKTAQAVRCKKMSSADIDDGPLLIGIERSNRQ